MVEYELALCYGIIVSADKMEEIKAALTDEEYDELLDNYASHINAWIDGGNYFIGLTDYLYPTNDELVYRLSDLPPTPFGDNDEDLIKLIQFFTALDLWKFIDWKPERMIINFCW